MLPERAYAGDAGLDLAACERHELATGGAGAGRHRPGGRDPRGPRRLRAAALGLAARHGLTVVNSPGLIDEGYRGEVRVVLLNTDAREPFVVEPGMRIAQLVVLPSPSSSRSRWTSCPRASAASAASARREQWASRGSGCPRSCAGRTACCSAGTRRTARSTGCCPAAASTRARASSTRSTASCARRSASATRCRRGPGRDRRLDRAGAQLRGRSTSSTSSSPAI